jgi:RNA recognition motif-containing protein
LVLCKICHLATLFQIAIKSGVIQRWGLVEFESSLQAETTRDLLNGHLINGKPLRVQVGTPKPVQGQGGDLDL